MKQRLLILVTGFCLLCACSTYSQQTNKPPISREQLFESLRGKLSATGLDHLIKRIYEWKVSFKISDADEKRIHQLQPHLDKKRVDRLIKAARESYYETESIGLLIPDSEATPPHQCGHASRNAVFILLGTSAGYSDTNADFSIPIIVNGEEVLKIIRTDAGVSLDAVVRSTDNKIVATISGNEFRINPNNYFRRERPDAHTLVVYDQENRAVLRVRYLNPQAIRVLGIFHYSGGQQMVIEEQRIVVLPRHLEILNVCLGNGTAFIVN